MKTISYPNEENLSMTVSRLLAVKHKLNSIESTKINGDKPTGVSLAMYYGNDANSVTQIIDFAIRQKMVYDPEIMDSKVVPETIELSLGDTKFTLSDKHLTALSDVMLDIIADMQDSIRNESQEFKESINQALSVLDT